MRKLPYTRGESYSPRLNNFGVRQFIQFYLFWVSSSLLFFLYLSILGMPSSFRGVYQYSTKRKLRGKNEAQKRYNYMNCRTKKW